MPCKVYAHLDIQGYAPVTLPLEVPRPEDTQFGSIKQAFLQHCADQNSGTDPIEYNDCCFWNQDCCPIADRVPIAVHAWEHNDFFLRLLPAGAGGSALDASHKERGELSYYYAHNRGGASLVSKPQAAAAAPAAAAPVAREPIKTAPLGPAAGRFNFKQSPFGTDITGYETITTYTWEDHDDSTVKVLLPLDGVGKLEPSAVRAQFGLRCFEILIDGYHGKNLRFATYKTHGEMTPDECKYMIRANRITIVLRKAKDRDIWFDLFKKRAIGDDDDP
mmetsp:Transcript_57746/g.146514  ORF Transcript_57746/g.146514 Transcript_57746/m.146514 type:complete len:276 (-) Transcript_57746:72-899(-)